VVVQVGTFWGECGVERASRNQVHTRLNSPFLSHTNAKSKDKHLEYGAGWGYFLNNTHFHIQIIPMTLTTMP